jgi:hypothetical protein
MGLCYLELNAVLGTGLGTDWPVAVDHASTMETSWVGALEPGLVDPALLPDDVDATIVGVYGPNPRFTADAERGAAQIAAAASLLAERAAGRLRGERPDPLADLRTFVERYWPERLELAGRAGDPGSPGARLGSLDGAAILITNPAPVSRYLAGLDVRIDGTVMDRGGMALVNPTVGEVGAPVPVAELGPERGFYVRRLQTAELHLPTAVAPGPHEVELRLLLAGVTEVSYAETLTFTG